MNALERNESDEASAVLVLGCLMSWLVGGKKYGLDSAAVVTWLNAHLSVGAVGAGVQASGFLGYPYAPDLMFNESHDELGPVTIAAMIWPVSGLVATAGGSDPRWIGQCDPSVRDSSAPAAAALGVVCAATCSDGGRWAVGAHLSAGSGGVAWLSNFSSWSSGRIQMSPSMGRMVNCSTEPRDGNSNASTIGFATSRATIICAR